MLKGIALQVYIISNIKVQMHLMGWDCDKPILFHSISSEIIKRKTNKPRNHSCEDVYKFNYLFFLIGVKFLFTFEKMF